MPIAMPKSDGTARRRRAGRALSGILASTSFVVLLLALASCGDQGSDEPVEFGTLLHGETAVREHRVPVPGGLRGRAPSGVELDCVCTTAEAVVDADDAVLLRLHLDTCELLPADQPAELHHGAVLFDLGGEEPERIPFRYRFAIESDFRLHPDSAFDFGTVTRGSTTTEVIRFEIEAAKECQVRAARSDDARVLCELDVEPEGVVVRATFTPGPATKTGLFGAEIEVATTRAGYTLRLPVRAVVVEAQDTGKSPR